MVTASHNPREYNGYKAYWSDGAQMISPHDVKTIEYVNDITSVDQIKFEADKSLIQEIGKDIDDQFLHDIHTLSLSPESNRRHSDMKIVYTPIHGTGKRLMYDSLKMWGSKTSSMFLSRTCSAATSPTVVSPNPGEQRGHGHGCGEGERNRRKASCSLLIPTLTVWASWSATRKATTSLSTATRSA